MKSMKPWLVVLLIGIALVVLYPVLVPVSAPVEGTNMVEGRDIGGNYGAQPVVIAGYFIALVGALGMFIAWIRRRSTDL